MAWFRVVSNGSTSLSLSPSKAVRSTTSRRGTITQCINNSQVHPLGVPGWRGMVGEIRDTEFGRVLWLDKIKTERGNRGASERPVL